MSTLESQRISTLPHATPISRLLRAALGLGMVGMVAPALQGASWQSRLEVLGVVVGLMALYTVVHLVVSRYFGWLHPWIGAAIAVTPAFLVFLSGGVFAAGAVVFIGASLLLIAALGHPGCEVLAFPALVLGRRTHLPASSCRRSIGSRARSWLWCAVPGPEDEHPILEHREPTNRRTSRHSGGVEPVVASR